MGWLAGWMVGWLFGWSVGRLVGWSVGRLIGWSVGRLVLSVGRVVCLEFGGVIRQEQFLRILR